MTGKIDPVAVAGVALSVGGLTMQTGDIVAVLNALAGVVCAICTLVRLIKGEKEPPKTDEEPKGEEEKGDDGNGMRRL